MKKSSIFFIIIYLLIYNYLDAHNNQNSYFTMRAPIDLSTESENDFYNFPKIDGSESKSNLRLQQYAYSVFQQCKLMPCCNGSMIPITKEDKLLVDRICADNQHYNSDLLRFIIARSSIINHAQEFMSQDNKHSCFRSDIFIDQNHFKDLPDSNNRIKKFKNASQEVLEHLHQEEKNKLTTLQNQEKSAGKTLSKSKRKALENKHKNQSQHLKSEHEKELKDGYSSVVKKHYQST